MSKKSDKSKIDFIIEKIDDINSYKKEFKTIENLLNSKLGYDAVCMCIMQIGETLNKLSDDFKNENNDLPYKESYLTRNYIAHDYEGISKIILESIIREHLPKIRKKLLKAKERL